jgi:hypothetical protein
LQIIQVIALAEIPTGDRTEKLKDLQGSATVKKNDVEQTIVVLGLGENRHGAAIVLAVTDEKYGAVKRWPILQMNSELWGFTG